MYRSLNPEEVPEEDIFTRSLGSDGWTSLYSDNTTVDASLANNQEVILTPEQEEKFIREQEEMLKEKFPDIHRRLKRLE